MASLKQEMREKYETHSSMAFFENNSGFEDGLLEKIINLSYAGLSPYSSKKWEITAVSSPVILQKLSRAAEDTRIPECAILLVVCGGAGPEEDSLSYENTPYGCPARNDGIKCGRVRQKELELLSLSIGCAAKYYCIDYFIVKTFDPAKIIREIPLRQSYPALILGLGFFKSNPDYLTALQNRNVYSETVRFL